MKNKAKTRNSALKLCITAMFSALLVAGKQAFAAIPNVEIITLFIAVCSYVWGLAVALPAVFVFIAVDTAIWGINTWVVSYVIHWNILALCFWGFSKLPVKHPVVKTVLADVLAVVLTVCFGVLTTAVDTAIGFAGGFYWDLQNFGSRFAAMYVAGVPFFVTHIISNAVVFAVGFFPLILLNQKAKIRLLPQTVCQPQSPTQSADVSPQDGQSDNLQSNGR